MNHNPSVAKLQGWDKLLVWCESLPVYLVYLCHPQCGPCQIYLWIWQISTWATFHPLDFHIWQHLEKHWNESQLQHLASMPSVPVGQLYSHMAKGTQHIYTFLTWRASREIDSILTLFSPYRSFCNGYRIAYTSRFGNILLLFLLLSTCQISTLTFTIRYHAIYNCGWWCRGSHPSTDAMARPLSL